VKDQLCSGLSRIEIPFAAMKNINDGIVRVALGLFIYTFLPSVSAFFGRSSCFKSIKWSNSNSGNFGCKNIAVENQFAVSHTALSAAPVLLADPMPNSIGNFFENKTDGMSFIQCYMLSVAVVDGLQYGKVLNHLQSSY
jgi:hypothetical protein